MKKKLGLFALCLSLVFAACNGPEKEPEASEVETEEDLEIELSDKKVEVDVLDKVEVEIENFDDLSKVKVESEDEEVAICDIDDGTITISGIFEGKTNIIVSAKGCEDVKISVKVNATADLSASQLAFPETDRYVFRFELDKDVWKAMVGDADPESVAIAEFFGELGLGVNFYVDFKPEDLMKGDATISFDFSGFGDELIDALSDDDNYRHMIEVMAEYEGFDIEDDTVMSAIMDQKDSLIETISDAMTDSLEDASESFDLTYTYSYPTLYLDGEGDVKECTVNEDGSFTLSLTAADLDNNPIFEGGLDMIFVPEK